MTVRGLTYIMNYKLKPRSLDKHVIRVVYKVYTYMISINISANTLFFHACHDEVAMYNLEHVVVSHVHNVLVITFIVIYKI